jgi:FtsZ-interacting cell division protein ZipA
MSGGIIAVIIVVVIVVVAAIIAMAVTTRRRRLQQQFGPEYDRAVTEQSSRLRAEAELMGRQRRVRKLDIRPLSEAARQKYAADWMAIQEQFVDSPPAAVRDAHDLVTTVMTERGYPTEDDEQVMADLSVEHAQTVSHFRVAQQITTAAAADGEATEDLRQALIHYRALFSDLLGDPVAAPAGPITVAPTTGTPITTPVMRDQADSNQLS